MQTASTNSSNAALNTIPPRLLSIADSATYAATSRSTLYAEEKAGRIQFVKIGTSTRVEVVELNRWIDQKTSEPTAA
ncbi:helix-turn-helix transcriptional regulator [Octadecabacter antarcticus]|uniref:helix-turn-helix transcriptional regulator n=1 Tax=Octadecabacter antarcticus TaxID=1217908 RepID=UPI00030F82BA|nr:helix-turn-helix domain-containing protein [Octadecabacter antarcticus]